jgi:hypothetical protein
MMHYSRLKYNDAVNASDVGVAVWAARPVLKPLVYAAEMRSYKSLIHGLFNICEAHCVGLRNSFPVKEATRNIVEFNN